MTTEPEAQAAADIVKWLEAIRDVVREAHFAADDSEDRSNEDPPIHCVPHSNFVDLCNALDVAEAFAREGELWNGPGPLVTRIIDALSTPAARMLAGEGDEHDLIERLLDAQQDINFAANTRMDQSLCDASALIDEIEPILRATLAHPPAAEPVGLRGLLDRAELAWQRFFYPAADNFTGPVGDKLPSVDLEVADCLRLVLAELGRHVVAPETDIPALATPARTDCGTTIEQLGHGTWHPGDEA